MTIKVQCGCGKSLQVKDELAGKRVRCPACKQAVGVPPALEPEEVGDDALQVLLTESPPRPPARAPREEAVTAEPPRPPALPERSAPPRAAERKKPKRRRDEEDEGWSFPRIYLSPGIITGLLMMVGAVVWFVLGLLADRIFFYPPIMFVLGLVAVVRGLLGRPED